MKFFSFFFYYSIVASSRLWEGLKISSVNFCFGARTTREILRCEGWSPRSTKRDAGARVGYIERWEQGRIEQAGELLVGCESCKLVAAREVLVKEKLTKKKNK